MVQIVTDNPWPAPPWPAVDDRLLVMLLVKFGAEEDLAADAFNDVDAVSGFLISFGMVTFLLTSALEQYA